MKTVATKASPQNTPAEKPLEETCAICGRVRWGNFQYLMHGKWRHEECHPGSESWCEWYDTHPAKHTDAGDLIRQNCTSSSTTSRQ